MVQLPTAGAVMITRQNFVGEFYSDGPFVDATEWMQAMYAVPKWL